MDDGITDLERMQEKLKEENRHLAAIDSPLAQN